MTVVTPVAGAVPITNFTAAQQALLRNGGVVGNYQILNGHVMDLRTSAGQALLAQRQTATTPTSTAPPATTTPPGSTTQTTPVFSPAPPKGAWMNPPEYFQGRTTYPDGSSVAGNQTGSALGAGPVADDTKDKANRDAQAQLMEVLGQYGLESLAGFAWQEIVQGKSPTEVLQDIRETPEFDARFPAIKQRQKAGLPALSPGDYVSYEKNATEYMRAAGLPKGFYDDRADFTKFLANDVSLNELGQRIDLAKQAAYQSPSEVRQALRGQFGLGDGDLAAFFLDPDKATPLLQRTFNAANIAGAATRTGYAVSADQDYRLADLGVSAQQAQGGFAQLGHDRELFDPLAGHANEGAITTDTQLAAQFGGNSQAQDLIEQRRRDRLAEFQDGGQFAAGQQGISGLGSAGDR